MSKVFVSYKLADEAKSVFIYNDIIILENILAKAYEYVVNGKSAIERIVERYGHSGQKVAYSQRCQRQVQGTP